MNADNAEFARPPRAAPENEAAVDFSRAMQAMLRRRKLVALCALAGAVVSLFVGVVLMPRYSARALLRVADAETADAARRDDGAIDAHVTLLSSRDGLDRVLAELDKDPLTRGRYSRALDLERHLKVMQELRSHLISVNFTARSPEVAARVANAIAQVYVDRIDAPESEAATEAAARRRGRVAELQARLARARDEQRAAEGAADPAAKDAAAQEVADAQAALEAERLSQSLARRQEESRRQALALAPPISLYALARPPEQPSSMRPILLIVPATLAAALFGAALALLLERIDRRVRTAADLRLVSEAPLFGVAPQVHDAASLAQCEAAMRDMAVNIFLGARARPKCMALAVAASADSRDMFAFELALAAARMKRVLLVTVGDETLAARFLAAAETARRRGAALECCALAPDETRLLAAAASGALARTLRELRTAYDWIVLAAPPAGASVIARVLARRADAVVVNVEAERASAPEVAAALREVAPLGESARAPIRRRVGFALTQAAPAASVDWRAEFAQWGESLRGASEKTLRLAHERFGRRSLPESRKWIGALARPRPETSTAEAEDEQRPAAIGGPCE